MPFILRPFRRFPVHCAVTYHAGVPSRPTHRVGRPRSCPGSTIHSSPGGARCNPVIRSFYQRLLNAGKAKKVALSACVRKLLTILNAMMNHRTRWSTNEIVCL